MMMAGTLGPQGILCGYNISTAAYKGDYEWDESGMSYQGEYTMMFFMAWLQLIFLIAQCCCCCVPLLSTPVKDDEYT